MNAKYGYMEVLVLQVKKILGDVIIYIMIILFLSVLANTFEGSADNREYNAFHSGASSQELNNSIYVLSAGNGQVTPGNYSGGGFNSQVGIYWLEDITKIVSAADLNLSFGPDVNIFRFTGCSPQWVNTSSIPQGQNTSHGIDYVCNNGTSSGTLAVRLSAGLNTGWQMFASNVSITEDLINLTPNPTTYKNIIPDMDNGSCSYIWYVSECHNATANPGAYEIYRMT